MRLALVVALAACGREPIASCDDDLRGVWRGDGGPWMILDGGDALELYPLFRDIPASELVVAPRVIDLHRNPGGITGTAHRRYMRGADRCDAHVPVRLAACRDDTLELVMAETAPPLGFAPCSWGRAESSRVERWRRE